MRKYLGFAFHGLGPLRSALGKGLKAYAIESAPGGAVTTVHLLVSDDSVVRVRSVQTTLNAGEWEEVDTLQFKHFRTSETGPPVSPLPSEWLEIVGMEKLIFECESFSAECGISLSNQIGGEFIISAGAFPGALALRAPFVSMEFEPQFDVAACRREALSI